MEHSVLTHFYDFNGREQLAEGILYLFYTNKREYSSGETVVMTLVKANSLEQEVRFTYPNTQYYDFLIRRDEEVVWRWAEGKFFLQVIQQKVLGPGDMLTVQEMWKIPAGIKPGVYQVEGRNLAKPEVKLSLPIGILP